MEKLSKMLNNVEDSYYDFIVAVLTYVLFSTLDAPSIFALNDTVFV